MNTTITREQRILGGLYGSLVGDALGVPVEFQNRDTRRIDPVVGMRAFGIHRQPAGTWSDDGALLLCSAESLAEAGFDLEDMGQRFLAWYDRGLWAATGVLFDIGNTTLEALDRISLGSPAAQAGGRDPYSNGNGSLMRILPVALVSQGLSDAEFVDRLQRASSITHAHMRSQMACAFHGLFVRALQDGQNPTEALITTRAIFGPLFADNPEMTLFRDLMHANIATMHEHEINSGGYVIDTLTASLWCLLTTDSFSDCVLRAVNLGSDTDTTGCVAGGLAGVTYGVFAIPDDWITALPLQDALANLSMRFANL